MGMTMAVVIAATLVAVMPIASPLAELQGAYKGLPDGNRATGIYIVDGGNALGGNAYGELAARLRGARDLPVIVLQPPAQHQ